MSIENEQNMVNAFDKNIICFPTWNQQHVCRHSSMSNVVKYVCRGDSGTQMKNGVTMIIGSTPTIIANGHNSEDPKNNDVPSNVPSKAPTAVCILMNGMFLNQARSIQPSLASRHLKETFFVVVVVLCSFGSETRRPRTGHIQ